MIKVLDDLYKTCRATVAAGGAACSNCCKKCIRIFGAVLQSDFVSCTVWGMSRATSLRIVPYGVCLGRIIADLLKLMPSITRTQRQYVPDRGEVDGDPDEMVENPQIVELVQKAIHAIPSIVTETAFVCLLLDWINTPLDVNTRFMFDSLYLITSAVGCICMMCKSIDVNRRLKQQISVSQAIGLRMAAVLCIGSGVLYLYNIYSQACALVEGGKIFSTLFPEQQEAILNARALCTLGTQKINDTVLILDGDPSRINVPYIGEIRGSSPEIEFLYTTFSRVLRLQVHSTAEFCQTLYNVTQQLGTKIHNLVLLGHGDSQKILLSPRGYFFEGSPQEMACMAENMHSRGNLYLFSCNPATQDLETGSSLVHWLKSSMPYFESRVTIFGAKAFFHPFFLFLGLTKNNSMMVQSHFPFDHHGQWAGFANMITALGE